MRIALENLKSWKMLENLENFTKSAEKPLHCTIDVFNHNINCKQQKTVDKGRNQFSYIKLLFICVESEAKKSAINKNV